MSSSLSQEGLTNRCSSGNCGLLAFPVGPLVVRGSAHRHSTMSEGRTHTEEVRWDYGEGMRGCCMLIYMCNVYVHVVRRRSNSASSISRTRMRRRAACCEKQLFCGILLRAPTARWSALVAWSTSAVALRFVGHSMGSLPRWYVVIFLALHVGDCKCRS